MTTAQRPLFSTLNVTLFPVASRSPPDRLASAFVTVRVHVPTSLGGAVSMRAGAARPAAAEATSATASRAAAVPMKRQLPARKLATVVA
jgi:hypothetical protein